MTTALEPPPVPPVPLAPPLGGDGPERTSRWIHVQDAKGEERWVTVGRRCVLVLSRLDLGNTPALRRRIMATLIWTDSQERNRSQTYYSLENAKTEGLWWLGSLNERLEDIE